MPEPIEQPTTNTDQDKYTGLSGFWGIFVKVGAVGTVAGFAIYLLTITLPSTQKQFREELKAERELLREQQEKSRDHGNKVSKELADAINNQTRAIDKQTHLIDYHQTMIQTNQEYQINLQKKSMK